MAVRIRLLLGTLLLASGGSPAWSRSDPVRDLDALVAESADPASAMALARRQMGEGELVGAAATLERVLVDYPESDEALLLHAALLCRLDDRAGARAELGALHGIAIDAAAWSEVTSACGPVPRPGRGR